MRAARIARAARRRVRRAGALSATRPAAAAPTRETPPEPPLLCWPLDHFYSPVPDNRALAREPARSRVWPAVPRDMPDIDWREKAQVSLMRDALGRQSELEFPDAPTEDPAAYHASNELFSRLDAWLLQGMLRHFRPHRMIEVGCGYSSLVTARVNREYLGGELHFTCVEPYPPDFLKGGVDGITELIQSRVEELSIEPFLELGNGDVLFIDTSHVVKTGGDVVFLFSEVLPRLASGVIVHVHDIFLPWDYPQGWVFAGRAWNEQYLVRAFLAYNSAFRILLGIGWMSHYRPDVLRAVVPGYPGRHGDGGGSLWIQRV